MGNTTLDLLIQARADFGAAKSQLTGLHQFLQGLEQQSKGVGGLIDLKPDTIKNIEALNKALAKTGQAGKALSAIQFPEAKFRAAAVQVEAMRRNFEQLQKTDLGKLARDLAKAAGQDVTNPLSWQWNKMTRGMQMQDAMILRNAYRSALYQPGTGPAGGPHGGGPGGPGSPGGGRDWGAYGARFGSWLGSGIGGGLVRTGGAIGSLALGGGIMGALFTGYRENQQMLEGVDAIFKSIGGNTGGFQALKEQVADLGGALQMTGAEASKLAETFVRTAGAADTDALTRAQAAGQFGRGLGLDPNASAQLFGRAGLLGVGNTRQTQRDFATLMGKTIADSSMFARSEQVMESMVGQLERIASTQGRTASTGEMENFGAILSKLMQNPALAGGGAQGVLETARKLGSQDMKWAMMFYEGVTGGDMGKTIRLAHADPFTPINEVIGGKDTSMPAEHVVRTIRQMAQGSGLDEAEFAAQFVPGISPELYERYVEVVEGKDKLKSNQGFRSWVTGLGMNPDTVQMSGIGTLSDIYANQGAGAGSAHINRLVSQANEYRNNGQLKDRPELLRELEAAMGAEGGPQQLQAVMAKIAGQVGAPLTEADKTRQAQADLVNALGKLGGFVNELVIEIKGGLTPAIKSLTDFIDMVTPDSEEQKLAKRRASQLKDMDDTRIAGWTEKGWLDDKGAMTDKFSPDPVTRAEYERIAVERKLGRYAPGTGSGPAPTAGGAQSSGNPTWNVAPPTAPNTGVTSGALSATASSVDPTAPGREHLLNMIAAAESGGNYNAMLGDPNQSAIDLTGMTMDEIDTLQTQMISERGGSAIGRYQYVQKTLRGLRQDLGIKGDEKFTPEMQDRLATESMQRRGLLDWEAGTLPDADFQYWLSQEWAGLPKDSSGLSYHNGFNGNRATISDLNVDASLQQARDARSAQIAIPAAAPAAPVAPVAVQPAVAPAAPPEVTPAVAPSAPVVAEPAVAPSAPTMDDPPHAGLASAAHRIGRDGASVPVHTITADETAAFKAKMNRERALKGLPPLPADDDARSQGWVPNAPPPTPEPVSSMSTPKSTDARVDGAVAININVAKDGKPVSETFRSLSFGEPRVPGSGGTLPKNNRVEWSHTV